MGALLGDALGFGVGAATVVIVSVCSDMEAVTASLVVSVLRIMVVTPFEVLVETAVTVGPDGMTVPLTVAPT